MHIRAGRYIGIAPLPGGTTNICLVKPSRPGDADLRDPGALLRREIAADAQLRDRFGDSRFVGPPVVLGPLAVDAALCNCLGFGSKNSALVLGRV